MDKARMGFAVHLYLPMPLLWITSHICDIKSMFRINAHRIKLFRPFYLYLDQNSSYEDGGLSINMFQRLNNEHCLQYPLKCCDES